MATLAPPRRPRARSHSETRPSTAPADTHTPSAQVATTSRAPTRPPRSLSRPPPPKINIDIQTVLQQSTPRRRGVAGSLALQARDSVSVRKRTMSTGAMSARVARQNARRANTDLLQPASTGPVRSRSGSPRSRTQSRSPARTPSTRTNSHRNRLSRSPSSSSSSPSQSPTPLTPAHPALSGPPSSYQLRGRTHVPHDSQDTTTSAFPLSSSHSSRSSSPSPERSRTPSPPRPKKALLHSAPNTPSLDLDTDDVNARLRLLVNNSYYLPPAHTKPVLSPIFPVPANMKGATSPSAFKEFFRVGKKKERKVAEANGYASEGARHTHNGRLRMPPEDSPRSLSNSSDNRFGVPIHSDGYFDIPPPEQPTRNRVVVVRETVDVLPPPVVRPPFRNSSLHAHSHSRPRTAPVVTAYNDPTTQYDMPPPTHYPSYTNLRLDAAGMAGNVQVDQFVPPGEPWSPAPLSPRRSGSSGGMDVNERVWRRAILEQAVDLSLSSAGSEIGQLSPTRADFSRGARVSNDDNAEPTSPRSPKGKKSWWGRREKDTEDGQRRPSTSSSVKDRDVTRSFGTERVARSLDVDAQPPPSPHRAKRDLGQCILPNVHVELEQLEREQARKEKVQSAGLPPPLRLRPFGGMSMSAPVTPLYPHGVEEPSTPRLSLTPLSPRPPNRRSEKRSYLPTFGERVAHEFMPGHSTIRKSLSSPLLSDLHETGIEVEDSVPFPSQSNESLDGVAAPSLVLQDPSGVTSLVPSHTADSFTTGSHYSEDDHEMFDAAMTPNEHRFDIHEDDDASLDRWNPSIPSPAHAEGGRPSFDSFGVGRVRSPEGDCPARASSTFGFRRSAVSVGIPSPLRTSRQDIEVDISGDPMEHLSMMESQRSQSPSAESQTSSVRGYVSAMDHTFIGSEALSVRPSSPASASVHSARSRLTSIKSLPGRAESVMDVTSPPPISFFDSVQHQSFIDGDDASSDSDADADQEADIPFAVYSERPSHAQTLGRKSLSTTRPTPAFSTQFRNASQPQLPVSRAGAATPPDLMLRPIQPYDLLDRKKPLTNTPVPASPTSTGGILSQFKAKPGKSSSSSSRPFSSKGRKKSGASSVVLPESTFELLRYPHGTAFSLGTGVGTTTASDAESAEVALGGFEGVRSQESLPSMRSSDATSLRHVGSWRQEQITQNDSVRKLDGMLLQHVEAERDRLRKIASAAKEKGGRGDRDAYGR